MFSINPSDFPILWLLRNYVSYASFVDSQVLIHCHSMKSRKELIDCPGFHLHSFLRSICRLSGAKLILKYYQYHVPFQQIYGQFCFWANICYSDHRIVGPHLLHDASGPPSLLQNADSEVHILNWFSDSLMLFCFVILNILALFFSANANLNKRGT